MGLAIARFSELRPCLYHTTSRANLPGICKQGGLWSAAAHLGELKLSEQESVRRIGRLELSSQGGHHSTVTKTAD